MRKLFPAVAIVLASAANAWADPVMSAGKIDAVTVYRGQAQVTRLVDLPAEAGLVDMVVTDLPPAIAPGSLFAEVDGGAEVRHVRYRTRAVEADVREGVRKIDEQLAGIALEVSKVQSELGVLQKHSAYLDKLEAFTAPTANAELTRGVLNADTLTKLSSYMLEQRDKVATETLARQTKLADLGRQQAMLDRQKQELTQGSSRVAREAVLLVDVKQAGAKLRVKYLVNAASWSPSYSIQATTGKPVVDVKYQAIVTQMSGEDWGDVNMTLSTATPNVIARLPELDPMNLTLRAKSAEVAAAQRIITIDDLQRAREGNRVAQMNFRTNNGLANVNADRVEPGALPSIQFGFNDPGQFGALSESRASAKKLQEAEIQVAQQPADDKPQGWVSRRLSESITVSYRLPNRTSLPSRNDQQIVGISTLPMNAEFYKVAMPLMSENVYSEATVVNDSKTVLLAGPSMSYLDGEFVGLGEMPTTGAGASFVAGFGIDSSISVTRDIVDRQEQTQGGNTIISLDYRIALQNFGDAVTKVRVIDRMPQSDAGKIKVSLLSSSVPLSSDKSFEPLKKQGLLRFDVDIPAKSVAGDAKLLEYKVQIEHDRNLVIGQ
jgi:hypothetical protein